MDEATELIDADIKIQNLIYIVRGKQVMLDNDLASLYHVETKNLNKAMKRNRKRFPEDFCFQLTEEEFNDLRFQIGTSSSEANYGGRSDIAIAVSIKIMKIFVELRRYLSDSTFIMDKFERLETKQIESELRQQAYEHSGNNINHPNDWFMRVYAQTLLQNVIGYNNIGE